MPFHLQQSDVPTAEGPEIHHVGGQLAGELCARAEKHREADLGTPIGAVALDPRILPEILRRCDGVLAGGRFRKLIDIGPRGAFGDGIFRGLRIDTVARGRDPTIRVDHETGARPGGVEGKIQARPEFRQQLSVGQPHMA